VSPEVIQRKLALLRTYCKDLREYVAADTVQANHYAVERLVQLIVETMYDVASHWLARGGYVHPDSYAEVFVEAGRRKLLSEVLASSLTAAARMRNLLVHLYERIDTSKLQAALPQLLDDAGEFVRQVTAACGAG